MPRAAVIQASGSAGLIEVPLPEPGEGEVRLRLEGSGVCGSDLPLWAGKPWFDYPQPPGAPGHEGWGVVDALGPGVAELNEGDRVAGLTYRAYADYDLARAADLVPIPARPALSRGRRSAARSTWLSAARSARATRWRWSAPASSAA